MSMGITEKFSVETVFYGSIHSLLPPYFHKELFVFGGIDKHWNDTIQNQYKTLIVEEVKCLNSFTKVGSCHQ